MSVPNIITVPFVGATTKPDNRVLTPTIMPYKVLLLGHGIIGGGAGQGNGAFNVPFRVRSANDVGDLFAIGSQIHQTAVNYFKRNKTTETWVIAIDNPTVSAAGSYTYTIAGTATENGTLPLHIDGVYFPLGVSTGDTDAELGVLLASLVAESFDKHHFDTTASAAAVLNLETKNNGTYGNFHSIESTFNDNDKVPAGLTVTIVNNLSGTSEPASTDIDAIITAMGETWYNAITMPWTSTTILDIMETELLDRDSSIRQIDGECYVGFADTVNNTITASTSVSRNSRFISFIDCYKYPHHPMYIAAQVTGDIAFSTSQSVAKPVHRITIDTLKPPRQEDRYKLLVLNDLSNNGVMTLDPWSFGGPQTFGCVTMSLRNSSGILDDSYRQQNTIFKLMKMRYDFVSQVVSAHPRSILVDDGSKLETGIEFISPSSGKALAAAICRQWETQGIVKNVDDWVDDIICRINPSLPDRLDFELPPELTKQFITGSADILFN